MVREKVDRNKPQLSKKMSVTIPTIPRGPIDAALPSRRALTSVTPRIVIGISI